MSVELRDSLTLFNEIPLKQNQPRMIALLRAKCERYDFARKLFRLEVVITVIAPAVALVVALIAPGVVPYAAAYGVIALVVGFGLERLQESASSQGAKLQELFDRELFDLEWRAEESGTKPAPEDVTEWARRHPDENELENWYPPEVGKLPLSLARIACQRSNGWWDSRMRNRYSDFLVAIAVATAAIVLIGMAMFDSRVLFLFELLFALSPIFIWSTREATKHRRLARERERIQERSERAWNDALSGRLNDEQLETVSRELQAEIYHQRKANAQMFAWAYSKYRNSNEEAMRVGVRELVAEFDRA
jgi:hypothetical protein